jgi:hypothetical protein
VLIDIGAGQRRPTIESYRVVEAAVGAASCGGGGWWGRAQPQRQPDWLDGLFDHREQFGGECVQVDLLAKTGGDCSTVRAAW